MLEMFPFNVIMRQHKWLNELLAGKIRAMNTEKLGPLNTLQKGYQRLLCVVKDTMVVFVSHYLSHSVLIICTSREIADTVCDHLA